MKYRRNDNTEIEFITILEDFEKASVFHHFKDKEYKIVTIATHTENDEQFVVYQAQYGEHTTYIRPIEMFFSKVDKEKYPEVKQEYRFQLGK